MGRCSFRYSDLPEHIKAQVDAQLAGGSTSGSTPVPAALTCSADQSPAVVSRSKRRGEPNKTEAAYRREVLGRRTDVAAIHFEGLTFRMANGHKYTPDWIVVTTGGRIECHEVKGGYALGSEQRAKLAFDQARIEFPWLAWVWARRDTGGQWTVTSSQ